ncbi:MAG: hypothetical protein HY676_05605 [Chloroflexi bacterium]|nr:hypothetical protein [Chloroflexota bacterium]
MPRACPEPSRRGGKRIGAGAPRGNFNALKYGRHFPQARAYLFTLLYLSPIVEDPRNGAALTFARRTKKQNNQKMGCPQLPR